MIRFILTICFFSILVDATDFMVQEQMICNIRKDWKYFVRYLEHDYATPNDILFVTEWVYVNGNSHGPHRVRRFDYREGDGFLDDHYEIEMEVFHTCTRSGEVWGFDVDLGELHIGTTFKELDIAGYVLDNQWNFV